MLFKILLALTIVTWPSATIGVYGGIYELNGGYGHYLDYHSYPSHSLEYGDGNLLYSGYKLATSYTPYPIVHSHYAGCGHGYEYGGYGSDAYYGHGYGSHNQYLYSH